MKNNKGKVQNIRAYNSYIKPIINSSEEKLVVNYADFETEYYDGELFVRLYVVVKNKAIISSAEPIGENYLGESSYKDIYMNNDGSLVFSAGKNNGLWVNAGRPLRALLFYDKYVKEGDSNPIVRSWLINVKKYREIFEYSTVLPTFSQFFHLGAEKKKLGDVCNVDNYTPNQFLVRNEKLNSLIVASKKGSLISYSQDPSNNEISILKLKEKVGMPKTLVTMDALLNGQDLQSYCTMFSVKLNFLFNIWQQIKNKEIGCKRIDEEIPSKFLRKKMMNSYGRLFDKKASKKEIFERRKTELSNFLYKEEIIETLNEDLASEKVETFMLNIVVPWANLAEAISITRSNFTALQSNAYRNYVL